MSQAVPVTPMSVLALLHEGVAAAQAGDADRARPLIRRAVELDPANETAWMWLANLSSNPVETVECVRKVLALNAGNLKAQAALPVALTRAGIATAQQGKKAAARAYLAEATALDPRDEAAWLWSAGVAESPEGAAHCLRQVLAINPCNERAKEGLARYTKHQQWQCPVCDFVAPVGRSPCVACRCVLSLADPAAFDSPTRADPARVTPALRRLRDEFSRGGDPEVGYRYAVACLNVGRTAAALPTLEVLGRHPDTNPTTRTEVLTYLKYFQARAAVFSPPPAAVRTVMVADDNPAVRHQIAATLEAAGFRVIPLPDGVQVAEAVRQHGAPDLILLDSHMPGLSGFRVASQLQKNTAAAGVPFVLLIERMALVNKVRGRWIGAAACLVKPFEPGALLSIAERFTANPHSSHEPQ